MTTATAAPFKNFRDAYAVLYTEVGETMNAFGYAHRLCLSLRYKTITSEEFDGLSSHMIWYCERMKIETTI